MPPRKHEAQGQRFGRWIALSEAPARGKSRLWNCLCDCGTKKEVWMESLISGKSTSCGCFQQEQVIRTHTRHAMSKSPEFRAWAKMLDRCHNPRNESYRHYGGRGISVCSEWAESFDAFFESMGTRPTSKHSIERRDNNGNYEPSNCFWATRLEQARNTSRTRMIEAFGERKLLSEWSYFTGLPETTIRSRLRRGWNAERALTTARGAQQGVKFHDPPDKRFGPPVGEKVKENAA